MPACKRLVAALAENTDRSDCHSKVKTARIVYDEKQPPSVSAVLQQMYDVNENPKVVAGRISATVHLLSPAQRPIQTTGDIGRFWREGYPAVKAQLRGRYPKHEWR